MSRRPRSLILTLSQVFGMGSQEMNRYYIVSTKKEHHARYPRMIRTPSRVKSRKKTRCKVKRRSYRS